MGWENVFHCEWNEFGKRVLKYYWPEAESFHDITKTDFKKYANQIDILSGGFPCQPYSMAGKRLGKEDERHLWPEMLRAIREIAPRYVVGENVRGLTNWNGGMVFDEVCADLENIGYQVAPYIIPSSAVNAPHQRERVWFIAYRNDGSRQEHELRSGRDVFKSWNDANGDASDSNCGGLERTTKSGRNSINAIGESEFGNASHTDRDGLEQRDGKHEIESSKSGINALDDVHANDDGGNVTDANGLGLRGKLDGIRKPGFTNKTSARDKWENFPTQSPLCGRNDGFPAELDGVTFSKWRAESIKAYGNAVVPQVVFEIFKAIEKYENL
jgi:DNA (cytosine-5)-methyltransferase 1